jgi:hypothetical protein
MAFTTDEWKGSSSADWGASSSNWSTGLPNSNSNVEIETPAVLTVSYSGSDDFVANSLTVGDDLFDMTGGSLTITTTASFADGFTQTGGTLTAGGKVTVTGTGTLTGGAAEGGTAFVFDGTVALANYLLGGSTSLSNEKTTNLTGATFEFQNDSSIVIGAACGSSFMNFGELEVTAGTGTSQVQASVTDTGTIDVKSGTIDFAGFENSFAGAISGSAGTFEIGGGVSVIEPKTISTGTFDIGGSSRFRRKPQLYRHVQYERRGPQPRWGDPDPERERHVQWRNLRRHRHPRHRQGLDEPLGRDPGRRPDLGEFRNDQRIQ